MSTILCEMMVVEERANDLELSRMRVYHCTQQLKTRPITKTDIKWTLN